MTVVCLPFATVVREKFMKPKQELITLAVPASWGPLTPPEQSTYSASEILGNVFETLIAYDVQGNLIPQLAQSWEVSPDLKAYTFILDTKRRFSDGTHLSSAIVKKAFEHSLTVTPASYNRSALDLFYRLEGFEEFSKTKTISGIEAPRENTIILKFTTPLRQGLNFLTGIRYGIYIVNNEGKYFGTGSYIFEKISDQEVLLVTNPYAREQPSFPRARIIGLEPNELGRAITENKADIFWTINPGIFLDRQKENLQYVQASGSVASHSVIEVNGSPGKIFSDPKLRRALQYIIHTKGSVILKDHFDLSRVTLDPQYLLPLQHGRLSQEEATSIINTGNQWVSDLIQVSKTRPIYFPLKTERDETIAAILEKQGVRVRTSDHFLTNKEALTLVYKSYDYDLLSFGIGFGSIDPDSIYHSLGRYGAITTPAIGRPRVWKLLEDGRSLTNPDEMNMVYTELSRAILEEVPTIHLGYCRPFVIFHPQKIVIKNKSLNSTIFHLGMFKP